MRRLAFLLCSVAIITSACENPVDPYAAKIDGKAISADVIDKEIKIVTESPKSRAQLNTELGANGGLQPGGDNTLSTQYTSNVVYTRILATLFDREVQRLNLQVTPAQRDSAIQSLQEDPEQAETIDSFPASYRDYLIDRQAKLNALIDQRNTPEAVNEYYEKNKSQFTQTCFRDVVTPTFQDALNARDRIVNGADFALIANDASTAQGGQADGGEIGCFSDAQLKQIVAVLTDAVKDLPVKGLTQPLQIQGAFHVVEVKSRTTQSLDEARPQIVQTLTSAQTLLADLLNSAKIEVNPRYGDWTPGDAESGTPGRVVPHASSGLTADPAPTAGASGGSSLTPEQQQQLQQLQGGGGASQVDPATPTTNS